MVRKKASADDVKDATSKTVAGKSTSQSTALPKATSKSAVSKSKTAKESSAKTAKKVASKTTDVSNVKTSVKKSSAKSSATKDTAKTSSVKTSAKNAKKETADDKITNVPKAENHDIIGEVMAIKLSNENKRTAKLAAKNMKKAAIKTTSEEPFEEKGSKASPENSRREAVKNNAKLAGVKKFLEMKENADTNGNVSENIDGEPRDGAFRAWIRAYKNIFNFKGRTSRYEFWSAMLINMGALFLLILGISFMAFGLSFVTAKVSVILTVLMVAFFIAEVFFYLSLFVRRLHDAGYGAWKGFFRPMILCWLLTSVISIAGVVIYNTPSFADIMIQDFTTLTFGAVLLLSTILYIYYNLKVFIAVGFFEEENKTNQYGAPAFCDAEHKAKTLRFASFYLLFIFVFYYLAQLISMWFAVADNNDTFC